MANIQTSRYLIVGGAGFFGARLAEEFAEIGNVVVTLRSLSSERKRWLTLHENRIVWKKFDSARDAHLEFEADRPYDCVFNLATPSAGEAASDPPNACEHALTTVRACLQLLRDGHAKRLIQVSTFHVYGADKRREYADGDAPQPSHPYGEIHAICEREVLGIGNAFSVGVVRPTNIVGAPAHRDLGPQWNLIFLDLCRQAVEKREVKLLTDGLGYRDFIPMPDAIAAFRVLACSREPLPREPFHLSLGKTMRLDDLAERIRDLAQETLGEEVKLTLGEKCDAFDEFFVVCNERLRGYGWSPENRLDDEIRRTVRMLTDLVA